MPDPDPEPFTLDFELVFSVGFAHGYALAHSERDAESHDSFGPSEPYAVGYRHAVAFLDAERRSVGDAEPERVPDGGPGPDPGGSEQLSLYEPSCSSPRCSVCSDGRAC